MNYIIKWRWEAIFALGTFLTFIGGEALRLVEDPTGTLGEMSLGQWIVLTLTAGFRLTFAALLPRVLSGLNLLKSATMSIWHLVVSVR